MTKLRKLRRRKKFRANVNRKRLRNKLGRKGKVQCKEIRENWEKELSLKKNMQEMGLVYDTNEVFKIPNRKQELKAELISTIRDDKWEVEDTLDAKSTKPSKAHVAEQLEKEAKAPRRRTFKLSTSQVEFITYLLDKYGHDYKAMVKDKRNYYQETWKQLRAKIKQFMKVPEQYNKYLSERGLLEKEDYDEKIINEMPSDDDSD